MALSPVVELAKTLVASEKGLAGFFVKAEKPALHRLKRLIGAKAYAMYVNGRIASNGEIVSAGSGVLTTRIAVDNKKVVTKYDMIRIENSTTYEGVYEVIDYDKVDQILEIEEEFDGTSNCTIYNETYETLEYAHAWLIVFFTTFTAQKIYENEIIPKEKNFGKGEIEGSTQKDIELLRKGYEQNAKDLCTELGFKQ